MKLFAHCQRAADVLSTGPWIGLREGALKVRLVSIVVAAGALLAAAVSGASAQTEAEFVNAFAGDWQIHDSSYSRNGQRCQFNLMSEPEEGRYKLENKSCGGAFEQVTRWGIVDGQMIFVAGTDVVATLGGNQRRMTGATSAGEPVILDRAGARGGATQLQSAYQSAGCYYLGFSDSCAAETELSKPSAAEGQPARINVLVNLNVRAEAREDANVVGVVPMNSCVVTEVCATAADGVWCRAQFGERTGWLRKLALRQNRWPIVTFVNQCPPQEGAGG